MFRVQDAEHYYRITWNSQSGFRRLVKRDGDTFTLLYSDTVGYTPGQSYTVEVDAVGEVLTVRMPGAPDIVVSDARYASGTIALHSNGNAGSVFGPDIVVTELSQ
jgi:hypothetical protein